MPIYKTKGVLTGTIEPENVATADAYLREHDMTQFLDVSIAKPIEHIEWKLEADGHNWNVTAFTKRELNDDERGKLWNADVCHWDASGGIDEDLFIADGTLGLVLDRVALFLMQESVKTEKLERLLDQRPEDM